jgi:hypothetical protein
MEITGIALPAEALFFSPLVSTRRKGTFCRKVALFYRLPYILYIFAPSKRQSANCQR